jgi:hypothetical protein
VEGSFAIQLQLLPSRVGVPLDQARAWYPVDPERACASWREALARARREERIHPESEFNFERTCRKILNENRYDDGRMRTILKLTGDVPGLTRFWVATANRNLLDGSMPQILAHPKTELRGELLELWRRRGSKDAIEVYLRTTGQEAPR